MCQDCDVSSPPPSIATHNTGDVCTQHSTGLEYCETPASYLCVITDGIADPKEDAFIEWFYHIEVEHVTVAGAKSFITGKFTFSASAAYINYWWKQSSSYTGRIGTGIPMFVQPSHNQF